MKHILFASSLFLSSLGFAQTLPYAFTVLNEVYEPLSDSISINQGEIWDDPEYLVPIGFNIQVMDELWNQLFITAPGALCIGDLMADSIHILLPVLEDICDVGLSTELSESPISYTLQGEPGARIFKVEWSNVGFYEEYYASNTNFNTFSFQLWLHEGTNVIEYRFGPSSIKGGNFFQFGGPMCAIGEDFANGEKNAWQNLWYLGNEPSAPTVELLDPTDFKSVTPLFNLPESGTVYHFGPLFAGQLEMQTLRMRVFPTLADETLYIETAAHRTMTLSILDLSGHTIEHHTIQRNLQEINIAHLPVGVYFVQIDGLGVQKFVKK
jgi:Secretion system C-terminal sorting domain